MIMKKILSAVCLLVSTMAIAQVKTATFVGNNTIHIPGIDPSPLNNVIKNLQGKLSGLLI
jgi:hypothetical protein